ncbi:MAG: 3-hydroxyacyl-[acyl-carrier-protein] dehydratase FabZ [Betaproteobacteria bacterium]|nr:MAG: 3-hydroxyacyl-[acyl-carrier-protein] dehydratase FabZ [Betaproteobacteria bacterium]
MAASTITDAANTGQMDVQSIMSMIPHRFPFLLVDTVTGCNPGVEITGYKNVTRQDCAGTTNVDPTFPRLLVLESLAQLTVILTFRSLGIIPTGKELMFFAGIDSAHFLWDCRAGERLDLQARVIRMMPGKGIGKFHTTASVGGKTVADARMMAAMRF